MLTSAAPDRCMHLCCRLRPWQAVCSSWSARAAATHLVSSRRSLSSCGGTADCLPSRGYTQDQGQREDWAHAEAQHVAKHIAERAENVVLCAQVQGTARVHQPGRLHAPHIAGTDLQGRHCK